MKQHDEQIKRDRVAAKIGIGDWVRVKVSGIMFHVLGFGISGTTGKTVIYGQLNGKIMDQPVPIADVEKPSFKPVK